MKYDIIIVGTGIAGLRAALEAKKLNPKLRILIVEKYNQDGGRMQTIHKTINNRKIQYESGAGRISEKHTTLISLIRHYGLHTVKLSDEIGWRKYGDKETVPNNFNEIWTGMCEKFDELPTEIKRNKTLRDISIEVLGVELTKSLLDTYGYRSEVEVFNAEAAIDLFRTTNAGFLGLKEGFSELIRKMVIDAKRQNVEFKHNLTVNRVDLVGTTYQVTALTKAGNHHKLEASRVILAVTRNTLQMIFPFSPEHPLMKATAMEPLLRIYSVYKDGSWFPKTKVVTNSALRMIIPIDREKGIIMSSYLDGRDIELWTDLYKSSKIEELKEKIHNETQALFPELNISEKPLYTSAEYWSEGCTYWKTGIDYKKLSESALQPYPTTHPNLHVIGESFSLKQQWIEGSLEHADSLIKLIEGELTDKKSK